MAGIRSVKLDSLHFSTQISIPAWRDGWRLRGPCGRGHCNVFKLVVDWNTTRALANNAAACSFPALLAEFITHEHATMCVLVFRGAWLYLRIFILPGGA